MSEAIEKREVGTIRGAMLGTGSIAVHHLRAWQAIPRVEIVALANRTRDKAVSLGSEFGIHETHVYSDYRDLLESEDVDFVDIATAPQIHREQVLAAAGAGVHVFCQKPFAPSMPEALEMVEACESAGVRCIVNENWRWRRWYRDLKEMLDEGVIGTPRYARLYHHDDAVLPIPDSSNPTLLARQPYVATMPRLLIYEVGVHYIDVMRFLFGDVDRVLAHTSHISPLVEGEDLAMLMMGFGDDMVGLIDISWGSFTPEERRGARGALESFVVEGDAGTIELDPLHDDSFIVTTAKGTERRSAHPHQTRSEAYQDSYLAAHSHFIDCLRTGSTAENDARDNLKTLSIALAGYESAHRSRWVSPDGGGVAGSTEFPSDDPGLGAQEGGEST
ncbi:MAG: Gfo/Idh/MocA family oxidoreductase [Proteobacteria bacterium]|nr:Gfo/Idh/MocA family oxidoreductase [Pseudomonadota bacterium]